VCLLAFLYNLFRPSDIFWTTRKLPSNQSLEECAFLASRGFSSFCLLSCFFVSFCIVIGRAPVAQIYASQCVAPYRSVKLRTARGYTHFDSLVKLFFLFHNFQKVDSKRTRFPWRCLAGHPDMNTQRSIKRYNFAVQRWTLALDALRFLNGIVGVGRM